MTTLAENTPGERRGILSSLSDDLPASLVVFLVAVPLSLGIALASGAPLMAGLIAAIVGGIVVGAIAGAPLQVSGPAAGLTVIIAGFVQQYGWEATCAITIGGGLLQMASGAVGIAPLALAMSPAVIHGMLAAIGVLIAASQLHVVLGHDSAGKGLKAFTSLPDHLAHLDPATTALGALTIAILVAWPMIRVEKIRRIPSALVAVAAATVVSLVFPMSVPRVQLGGSLLEGIALPTLPAGSLPGVIAAVLTLWFVASAESLLSAVATDKLHTGPRANLNRELIGQGVANTLSGLLGGLPITGVVVRSTANITAGAKTQMSAIFHGVWVLLFVTLLPGVITRVPLAALAGLLVYTGARLVNPAHIRDLRHHGELSTYLVTLVAIVMTNLLMGLGIGFGVALFRLLWRLTHVEVHVERLADRYSVAIEGTLTFAGVPRVAQKLAAIPIGAQVEVDLGVRFMDHAGYEALRSWKATHEKLGGKVTMEALDQIWARSRETRVPRERREQPASELAAEAAGA